MTRPAKVTCACEDIGASEIIGEILTEFILEGSVGSPFGGRKEELRITRRIFWMQGLALAALTACGGGGNQPSPDPVATPWPDALTVQHPQQLPAALPASRIPLGIAGDYKPNLALLPNGEILLVMFEPQTNPDGTYQENMILYRSGDNGEAWGNREVLPLLGREPYLTVLKDGTIFITAQLISTDYRNTLGYDYAIVHRSTDSGHTWDTLPILATWASPDFPDTEVRCMMISEVSDGKAELHAGVQG